MIRDTLINDFFRGISSSHSLDKSEVERFSPLVLAYVGDAVFEVFIRTMLVAKGEAPVYRLHGRSIGYVKAKAQSDIVHRLMDSLTPVEQDIVRRGRNAKSGTIPKNADVTEYRYATGFEALLGYLYLTNNLTRLQEILKMSVDDEHGRD